MVIKSLRVKQEGAKRDDKYNQTNRSAGSRGGMEGKISPASNRIA